MGDPGFVPGTIGVGIQMLVSKMIEWIKRAACCEEELDKLKHLLCFNLSIYAEIRINANKIGSLPDPVDEWLAQLKEILQNGSKFVEACTVPPRWQINPRGNLTKEITRFISDLRDHLASNSLIISLQQLHLGVAIEQLRRELESLKQSISPPGDVLACSTSDSSAENDVNTISLELCFLRLAAFTKEAEEVIYTERAIKYWIREGFVAGPDHLRTGQTYVNMLADRRLIEPIWKDDDGDVCLFRMPDDFHGLAHQIVEEEQRLLRTVRDSQEFSFDDERPNALLKIHINRGTNLAVRDKYCKKSSDPYVVAILNDQKKKTGVIRRNLNPVWNEELSLPLQEPQSLLLKLEVYDKDRLSRDDHMGYGEVDLNNLARAARILRTTQSPSLATMNTGGLCIECVDGHMVQKVCLKLNKVESGELYLHIKWVYQTDATFLLF